MSAHITLAQVRAALSLDPFDAAAAHKIMAPKPRPVGPGSRQPASPKQAAVLLLIFPTPHRDLALVLVRRAIHENDIHSGQIGFPGGAQEPGESVVQTALREAREEVGLNQPVTTLGSLASLYIPPSNYEVHPLVAYTDSPPLWQADPAEVAEIIECPLDLLVDDARKTVDDWDYQGTTMQIPWYNVYNHKVWGATAIILSEFEQRLRQVGGPLASGM